jgi:UPF0716 protein FxsA
MYARDRFYPVAYAEHPAQVARGRTINDPGRNANIVGTRFPSMALVKRGLIGFVLLPIAEVIAFIVVASLLGWFWATCLFLATTFVGLLMLWRTGAGDIERFRAALRRDGFAAVHLDSPGLGPMIGAILLVFPGFITDILGALLLLPAVRRQLRRQIARARDDRRRQREPSVIDLTPQEWRQVPDLPTKDERQR